MSDQLAVQIENTAAGPNSAAALSSRTAHTYAVIFWLCSLALFRQPLSGLVSLSFHDELSSHILLIPLISAIVIYLRRDPIFRATRYCPAVGAPLLLAAVALWFGLHAPLSSWSDTNRLSVAAAAIVLAWIGGFILFYGTASFKAAAFPLLFLFLMIPLPVAVADYAVSALQGGSANTCYLLFRLIGVPVTRHGFQFSLPGIDIQIAEQCSGIHSALSLLISGLLAGQVFLPSAWKKIVFVLFILPIAIFKNAVRIVTIAWLGIHVDAGFFYGELHRQGGLPFSLLAIAIMALLLWMLRNPAAARDSDRSRT